jgi:hypothetical protein
MAVHSRLYLTWMNMWCHNRRETAPWRLRRMNQCCLYHAYNVTILMPRYTWYLVATSVFWVVTSCDLQKAGRFGGAYRLYLQDQRINKARRQQTEPAVINSNSTWHFEMVEFIHQNLKKKYCRGSNVNCGVGFAVVPLKFLKVREHCYSRHAPNESSIVLETSMHHDNQMFVTGENCVLILAHQWTASVYSR